MARKKITVLGGGIGALSAVHGLTSKPGWEELYDIDVYQLGDLRIARRFAISDKTSMELIADGFNIFNRVNFKEVNGSTGGALTLQELGFSSARVQARGDISPNQFGAFTSAYDPRVIQLAVKVNF